jgi:hypothetical protein
MSPHAILIDIEQRILWSTGQRWVNSPANLALRRKMARERGLYRFEPIDTEDTPHIIEWIEQNGGADYVFTSLEWWFTDPEVARHLKQLFG